jgi:mono/diheme cytochrome c family protein
MPPFRVTDYTDAELATLATWINAQPAAPGAPTPITPKAPVQLPNAVANGSSPDAIYTGMCSSCHDNGAPPLPGRALLDGYVKVVVRHGVRSMPAFPAASITDADLTALATWLNEQPRRAP